MDRVWLDGQVKRQESSASASALDTHSASQHIVISQETHSLQRFYSIRALDQNKMIGI